MRGYKNNINLIQESYQGSSHTQMMTFTNFKRPQNKVKKPKRNQKSQKIVEPIDALSMCIKN